MLLLFSSNILQAVHQFCHYKVCGLWPDSKFEIKSTNSPEETVELNFNWKSKARIGFSETLIRRLNTAAVKYFRYSVTVCNRPTKDYRMLDESISQQRGNNINKLCPCFSGAYWFDAVNKIQLLSNMANVLSILLIPVFARSFGTSYFEVGLIVSVYSTATLISSFIFGRFADYYHPRTNAVEKFRIFSCSLHSPGFCQ